jgi:hypothetical protein
MNYGGKMHPIRTLPKSPDSKHGFLLPFDYICNIGELHLFSMYLYSLDIWSTCMQNSHSNRMC